MLEAVVEVVVVEAAVEVVVHQEVVVENQVVSKVEKLLSLNHIVTMVCSLLVAKKMHWLHEI